MTPPPKTRPARRGPPPVSREITKILAELARKSGAMDPELAAKWPEIVGPDLAKICRPVRIRQIGRARTLEVSVTSGAFAMQLQFKQDLLRQKVNTYLGKNSISRISIRQSGQSTPVKKATPLKPAYSQVIVPPEPATIPEADATAGLPEALSRMKALLQAGKRSK